MRKMILTTTVAALAAFAVEAKDDRVEISGTIGWTFSDGVSGTTRYARLVPVPIDPKDAFSWGVRIGYMARANSEIGFLFGVQSTTLQARNEDVAKMGIFNYHAYFAQCFGDARAKARPYLLAGLGVTQYGPERGSRRDYVGETRFSSTWAVGVKVHLSQSVGIRLESRWTPTLIDSDSKGYWCGSWWGCHAVSDGQYANQFATSGGITFRF